MTAGPLSSLTLGGAATLRAPDRANPGARPFGATQNARTNLIEHLRKRDLSRSTPKNKAKRTQPHAFVVVAVVSCWSTELPTSAAATARVQ